MTRKARSSTICEWALGVSVEEYCDSVARRRGRKSSGRQRISVEISTDDESEEDTIKITYPHASLNKGSSGQSSGIKKVRFDNVATKSALKASVSELSKDKVYEAESSVKSASESEDGGTETTETDTETEDETPPSPKKKKSSDSPKKQDNKKDNSKSSKKNKESAAPPDTEPNNVGPASRKGREKDAVTQNEKSKKNREPQKLRPEAALSPHLRRPNLIMPVRAEVLQVEHTIEGVEDPRPNAFHDPQHGVLRVYHGPAYGNPYGLLYPARDPNKATLPIGVPHPLHNPYFHGFANPTNPGDNHFKGQFPWGPVPITGIPGGQPVMAPVDPTQMPPYWVPIPTVKTASTKGSPKPVMSGANGEDTSSTVAKNKEKGWDTNVGPQGNSVPSPAKLASPTNVAPSSPININLTVNPNTPWAACAGNLSKKSSPDKNGSQAGSKVNGGGSNTGSKKSWGSKKTTEWQPLASGQHADLSWDIPVNKHERKSGWPRAGDANNDSWGTNGGNGSNSGWNNSGNTQNNDAWGASDNTQGNNDQTTFGDNNNNNWTSANDNSWNISGNNNQPAAMNSDRWRASNDKEDDAWANTGDNHHNWTTTSNHSGSKRSDKGQNSGCSNRSASGQARLAANWESQSNNVGFSGGRAVSNGSNRSHRAQSQAPASNGGWDNNAGPTTNSPLGNTFSKSSRSKQGSKKGSPSGDAWGTASNSAWAPPDNNAGPTTNNSPHASQTSKKSSASGGKKDQNTWAAAGDGAGWGPGTTGGEVDYNPTATEMSKGSGSNKSMPGAWDNMPPWGDPTLAQSTGGQADNW
ncbi:hypothetical protein EsH8_IV_000596 [Colletotrichum jinshuiense]